MKQRVTKSSHFQSSPALFILVSSSSQDIGPFHSEKEHFAKVHEGLAWAETHIIMRKKLRLSYSSCLRMFMKTNCLYPDLL